MSVRGTLFQISIKRYFVIYNGREHSGRLLARNYLVVALRYYRILLVVYISTLLYSRVEGVVYSWYSREIHLLQPLHLVVAQIVGEQFRNRTSHRRQ
jgi:hypothetical protein